MYHLDDQASDPGHVLSVVPQGSVLGLVLFFLLMIFQSTSGLLFDYLQMVVFYIGILTQQRIVKFCQKTWIAWYVGKQIGK